LTADFELEEIIVLENLGVGQSTLDHGFWARLAVALEQLALERAGIDADAHRAAVILRRLDHFLDTLGRADIARD
jgi:hypothetical protein